MNTLARGCTAFAGLAVVAALSITHVSAQPIGAGVWDGCSAVVPPDSTTKAKLMAPAGSPGVQLQCKNCTQAPDNADKAGSGELLLKENSPPPEVEVVRGGTRYVVRAVRDPAKFKIAGPVPWDNENETVSLIPGQAIDVTIPDDTVVRQRTVAVQPDIVPADAGPEIRVIVDKPGETLSASDWQASVRACFVPVGGKAGRTLPVVRVEATEPGVAVVTLRAPASLFASEAPWWQMLGETSFLVYDNSGFMGEGSLTSWRPWFAMAVSLFVTAAIFVGLALVAKTVAKGLGTGRKAFLLGLFTSRDGDASLSLFQVFLWTVVTVWALSYVFFRTSDVLTLTPQIMVLLGFASATSVSARWIASGQAKTASGEDKNVPSFWAMLIVDEKPDLLKVQLFAFTVLGAAYVVWKVATSTAFPVLDENLLLLMGVSNLAYLGGKLADRPSAFDKASDLDRKRAFLNKEKEQLTEELTEKKEAKDDELAKAQDLQNADLLNELNKRIEEIEGADGKGGLLAAFSKELIEIDKKIQETIKKLK